MQLQDDLPTTVFVAPASAPLGGSPGLPGTKYATVRTVLAAALATGTSTVTGIPWTDDTAVLLAALRAVGCAIEKTGPEQITIQGCGGRFPVQGPVQIDAGNAGAVLRLLLGVLAPLPEVHFATTYTNSLGMRPNADLLTALTQLGIAVSAQEPGGRLPITLRGTGLHGGPVTVSGANGSQFLSALLLLSPLIGTPVAITVVDGLRSAPFVRLTLATLEQAGIVVQHDADLRHFDIAAQQHFQPRAWQLARDYPTAALWLATWATAGGALHLHGLDAHAEDGQAILHAFAALGMPIAAVADTEHPGLQSLSVDGSAALRGATIEGDAIIDSVPALAAAACFADGTTTFTNVAALRLKESDRIGDLCAEFRRAGAIAIPGAATITIVGQPAGIAGGVTVDAHNDHRLAMALAVLALRSRLGLTITGAQHVAKSYPAFWRELARLGATVTPIAHDAALQ